MRIPNILKDLLPAERLKPLLDLANQDKITAVLKDVAEQIGWKGNASSESATPKSFPTKELQQVVRQAKWWFDSLSQRFQTAAFVPLHQGINGTGQLFSSRWIATPVSSDAVTAMSMVHSGFCVSDGLVNSLNSKLCSHTGAQGSLVTTNVESALLLLSAWLASKSNHSHDGRATASDRKSWAISRGDCIRLPSDCDVVMLLQSMNPKGVIEVGASNDCRPDDFLKAVSQGAGGVFRVISASSLAPEFSAGAASQTGAMQKGSFTDDVLAADFGIPKVALAWTAMLKDFSKASNADDQNDVVTDEAIETRQIAIISQLPSVKSILDAGADIVVIPGNGWVGGPACGLLLGNASMIDELKRIGQELGLFASTGTLAGLRSAVENASDRALWQESPIGQIATNSIENLEHRANKILIQLEGIPTIESARVERKRLPVGPSLWQTIQMESYCIVLRPSLKTPNTKALHVNNAADWQQQLAKRSVPIESLVIDNELVLALRTIHPADDQELVTALAQE